MISRSETSTSENSVGTRTILSVKLTSNDELILETGRAIERVEAGYKADQTDKSISALHQVGAKLVKNKYLQTVGVAGSVLTDVVDFDLLSDIGDFIRSFVLSNLEEISSAIAKDDQLWDHRKNYTLVTREWIYYLAYLATRPLRPSLGYSHASRIYLIHELLSRSSSATIRDTQFSIDEYVELCHYYQDPYSLYLRVGFKDTDFIPDLNRIFCLRLFEQMYGQVSEFHSVIPYTWFIYPCVQDMVNRFYAELKDDLSLNEEDYEN